MRISQGFVMLTCKIRHLRVAGMALIALAFSAASLFAASGKPRFFEPTPGFQAADDLAKGFSAKVDSIVIVVRDAFDGAETHSEVEAYSYSILNSLHIQTRESVIRRRLLFREGDSVNSEILRETEKNLRSEEFLADAYVEIEKRDDSTSIIKVTTFDQWTTTLGANLNRKGGEWIWWLGPVESNLLGYGQRLGFFVGHDLEHGDMRWFDYANTYFTPLRLALTGSYTWMSDGYSYKGSISRPLRSREDAWGFTFSMDGSLLSDNLYLSGNDIPIRLLDSLQAEGRLKSVDKYFGKTHSVGYWNRLGYHATYLGVTRTFGHKLKASVTPYYNRVDRYLAGRFNAYDTTLNRLIGKSSEPSLYLRHNEEFGTTFSLYQYDFKTVRNFRNLKWSENIETGWRLSTSIAQNQTWLGANQDDWYFSHAGVYNDTWANKVFLNSSASMGYFLRDGESIIDGTLSGNLETQWKPLWWTSFLALGSYSHIFSDADSRDLTLGDDNGLNGYPNFFYAGKARVLMAVEERFFPPLEALTLVPALAIYFNAGNTYATYNDVDLGDLHYAAGIGLRIGFSKSVQKVVNHLNLSWPVGEKHLSGPVFGIKATKGL